MNHRRHNLLPVIRAGIDTYRQPVVYMREDCHLCRSEGFSAQTRVEITLGEKSIVATLNVVRSSGWLAPDTAALSEAAWTALAARPGARAHFAHPPPARGASAIRAKVNGRQLAAREFSTIIRDIVDHRLSDLEIAAFVAACAGDRLTEAETVALTGAMVDAGRRLDWGKGPVLDKHCVGGLPGNRTTPLIVPIVAAAGHLIPKTSSRAITSPAGTADTVEVMTPVTLGIDAMRRVVEREGGCMVWGGGLDLSPADDLLIRIERPLEIDSEGQMVASIMSKKIAAGSTHAVIDMPIGPTAKVRDAAAADKLSARLLAVAKAFGLRLAIHRSDGTAPVGRGVGPALEARDVLAVLRRQADAPADLRARALDVAGAVLDLVDGGGRARAAELLDSGAAEAKFMAICAAQGGFSEPPTARHRQPVRADRSGIVRAIDNRRIARIAKLAGAPGQKAAGVLLHARLGERVERGQPLYEVHAETRGELLWSLEYATAQPPAYDIGAPR